MTGTRGLILVALAPLIFITSLDPERVLDLTHFFVFQARDLHRARTVLEGIPIFFGPEVTGGGNLPGGFYYYLLAPALYLGGGGWMAAWKLMMLLFCAGAILGVAYFWRAYSALAALVFLVAFGAAPLSRQFLKIFLNVSYLPFFAVAALLCICESWRAGTERARSLCLVGACFLIALGSQLHLSVALWLFAIAQLEWKRRRLPDAALARWALPAAVAATLAPLVPWLVWFVCQRNGLALGQQRTGLVGYEEDVIPTYLRFFNYVLETPPSLLIREFPKTFEAVPVVLLAAWLPWKRAAAPAGARTIELPALLCAAWGFIAFLFYYVVPIGFRYGLPFYLPLVFLLAHRVHTLRENKWFVGLLALLAAIMIGMEARDLFGLQPSYTARALAVCCAALGLVAGALATQKSRLWPALLLSSLSVVCLVQRDATEVSAFGNSYISFRIMPSLQAWRTIWPLVYSSTGWSYDEAVRRTFFLQHHLEQDPRPIYEETVAEYASPKIEGRRPDGFFVSIAKRPMTDIKGWILSMPLNQDLRRGLDTGAIRLGEGVFTRTVFVIPYFVDRPSELPAWIHNTGEGYIRTEEEQALSRFGGEAATEQMKDGSFVFHWSDCPGKNKSCSAAAIVKLQREGGKTGLWRGNVRVIGSSISQSSPWIVPSWTEAWVEPYVEFECGKEWRRFPIAAILGYDRRLGVQREDYPFNYTHSLVAPLSRDFSFRCAGDVAAVAVGREGSLVDNIRSVTRLGPKRLVHRIRKVVK